MSAECMQHRVVRAYGRGLAGIFYTMEQSTPQIFFSLFNLDPTEESLEMGITEQQSQDPTNWIRKVECMCVRVLSLMYFCRPTDSIHLTSSSQ